jgi:hypothetical protein
MPDSRSLRGVFAVVVSFAAFGAVSMGLAAAKAPNPYRIWATELKRHGHEKEAPCHGCRLVHAREHRPGRER